ncbi:cupredoxin domain-containing protein [Conexibacter arvalis]|uniref:Plastocyanin n=1 Tax=Conexibacter arvalis TaxID=912552 RepID=A0A840IGJ2_9ACTN|nr:plastocyanin/azurin family copper-binding protein [Conexibacter arvalis]MBB4663361.1 plastocyanin [Conexibacter arvalis]
MKRSSLLSLLLATGALALAGCGGDGSGTSTGGSNAGRAASSGPKTTADGGIEIAMKGIAYSPQTVSVRVGQRITWVNEDDVLHDVASTSGDEFKSELYPKGESYSWTPTEPGRISYVCTIHPGMEGTLDVTG